MDVDINLPAEQVNLVAAATAAETAGYSCAWMGETKHDPLVTLPLAAFATSSIRLGTGVSVGFARSPMTLAVAANDLQLLSEGRFVLGLGSQVKAHITRRYSMPWESPAARMRELILAVRAIWTSWETGERLDFQGEHYSHTLMTPFFDPGPNPYGRPQIFLAGVGALMTAVAGEVADGFLCHGFTTERYIREVTIPRLRSGADRSSNNVQLSVAPFVVTGRDEESMRAAAAAVRAQLAFYGSTPTYRPVLELHGWEALGDELSGLARRGDWDTMGDRIDDEVLSTFAVVAEPGDVATALLTRFGDIADRMALYLPYDAIDVLPGIVAGLTAAG